MTYRQKIIKIFDRLRPEGSEYAGTAMCDDVDCNKNCPFNGFEHCVDMLVTLTESCKSENIQKILKIIDENEIPSKVISDMIAAAKIINEEAEK